PPEAVPEPEPAPMAETDTDGDGVPDALDACVQERGTREQSGCPADTRPLVTLTRERLVLHGQVFFEPGASTLTGASRVLDELARVLLEHPELPRVLIEGHTDTGGSDAANQRLSLARAEAVLRYLVQKGVPAWRLEARGFGARRPASSNATQEGREQNRRAELRLLIGEPAPPPPQVPPLGALIRPRHNELHVPQDMNVFGRKNDGDELDSQSILTPKAQALDSACLYLASGWLVGPPSRKMPG
ncbi:OmpA family protein, partial [Corallococcus sp. CA031C]